MSVILIVIAHALWVVWVVQSVLSVLLLRKFRRKMDRPEKDWTSTPFASVIVPFKGVDLSLADNVASLCRQDYPDYELLCVVESEDDPAYTALRTALAAHPACRSRLIVAGGAPPTRGQKVHNQLAAMAQASASRPRDLYVFADSDAVPGPDWLARMAKPLGNYRTIAATTGYRWLVPTPAEGAARPTIWSHLASVINSSAASFYARDRYSHAWGGSMALRRDTAEAGDLRGALDGALSDDYQLTAMCKRLGKRIYFVSSCLVASPVAFDARRFFGFARRQYLITRIHAPLLYWASLCFQLLYTLGFLTAAAALLVGLGRLLSGGGRWAWVAPAAAIVVVTVMDVTRSAIRRSVIRRALGEDTARAMRTTLRIDRWLTPLWMATHLIIVLSACVGRTIVWRGNRYRMDGPQQIERLQ